MLKKICIILLYISFTDSFAQIGIGTISPDASSALDISSTEKGVLVPRLSTTQRDAVTSPAKGLIIYNTSEDCLQVNYGSSSSPAWTCMSTSGGGAATVGNDCNINGFEGTYVNGQVLTASNTFSVTITNNSFSSVSISFTTGDLVLSGVSGVTVSSVNPTSATLNSGDSQIIEYSLTGTPAASGSLTGQWTKLGLNCSRSVDVVMGDATFSLPNGVLVASVLDGTPLVDIQGIIDNGANQLTIELPYTSGVGSYEAFTGTYVPRNANTSEGGDSNSFRISYPSGTFSASGSITATVEVDGDGSFDAEKQLFGIQETIATLEVFVNGISKGNVNLDVIGGIPDREFADANHKFIYIPIVAADGNTWLNNNLGANYANMNHAQFNPNQQATSSTDYHAYGSSYQWGRYSDGHELINYTNSTTGAPVDPTTSVPHSTTTTPNNTIFYLGTFSPTTRNANWLDFGGSPNATEDGLWQGESGPNNPCPAGYRVPTNTELSTLFMAEGISNATDAANSALALTTTGYRNHGTGGMFQVGDRGYTWSSSISSSVNHQTVYISYYTSLASSSNVRALGASIRCIQD